MHMQAYEYRDTLQAPTTHTHTHNTHTTHTTHTHTTHTHTDKTNKANDTKKCIVNDNTL